MFAIDGPDDIQLTVQCKESQVLVLPKPMNLEHSAILIYTESDKRVLLIHKKIPAPVVTKSEARVCWTTGTLRTRIQIPLEAWKYMSAFFCVVLSCVGSGLAVG